MSKTGSKQWAKNAAKSMASLYVFASVAGLLECGSVHVESDSAARRIIKICEEEQQRCLKRYDKEIAKIEGSHA